MLRVKLKKIKIFVEVLLERGTQLDCFDMSFFFFFNPKFSNRDNPQRMSAIVQEFLRSQTSLQQVLMNQDFWDLDQGLNVLSALTDDGRNQTITDLEIRNFVRFSHEVYKQEAYITAMRNFKCLEVLSLNYNFLSDEILEILTENCGHSLRKLYVLVDNLQSFDHVIADKNWARLKAQKTTEGKLETLWNLQGIQDWERVTSILQPSLPCVKKIELWHCVLPHGKNNHTFSD